MGWGMEQGVMAEGIGIPDALLKLSKTPKLSPPYHILFS